MAQASAPNPMNLLLLAGVGIAAFWAFSRMSGPRQTAPAPLYPTSLQNRQAVNSNLDETKALRYQLTASLIGRGLDFWETRARGENPYSLASDWGTPLASDGVAYNPSGNASASDSIYSLASGYRQ